MRSKGSGLWGLDRQPRDCGDDSAALPHMPWIQPGPQPLCQQERALFPRTGPWNQGGMRPVGGWRDRKSGDRADRRQSLARMASVQMCVCSEPLTVAVRPHPTMLTTLNWRPPPWGPLLPAIPPASSLALSAAGSRDTVLRPRLSLSCQHSCVLPNLRLLHPPRGRGALKEDALALTASTCIPAPTWMQVTCTPGKAGPSSHSDVS